VFDHKALLPEAGTDKAGDLQFVLYQQNIHSTSLVPTISRHTGSRMTKLSWRSKPAAPPAEALRIVV
jgi:hypothetical protein